MGGRRSAERMPCQIACSSINQVSNVRRTSMQTLLLIDLQHHLLVSLLFSPSAKDSSIYPSFHSDG
eukprot:418507-Pelagomonas_calceolata.AAC.3